MSVLVTGGAGYLGGIVAETLASESLEIIALDRRKPALDKRLESVTYLLSDIRSPDLADVFREHAVETVVHLAAIVEPGKMTREEQYDIDVLGAKNVLDACVETGIRKIIISSSGAAYGYHADNPAWLTESDALRGNQTFPYAHHKRLVEEMLADYRREHPALKQVIFRIGTILGATVNNQITALFDKPFVLGIKGSHSPFVFIWDSDVAGAVRHAVFSERTGAFNLAGDGAVSLPEIAEILGKKLVSLPPALVKTALAAFKKLHLTRYGPEQMDFIRFRPVLDNARLKKEFGYIPQKTSREVFEFFLQARQKID